MPELVREGIYEIAYAITLPGQSDPRRGRTTFAILAPSGPAASPEEQPFWFGCQYHAHRFSPEEQSLAAQAYSSAGLNLIRNGTQWNRVQPKKDVWDFRELAGRIKPFQDRKIRWIGAPCEPPGWAKQTNWIPYKKKNEVANPNCWPGGAPPDHQSMREWTRRLSTYFPRGTFAFYELQNEPELIFFCNYSPKELAELQKIVAEEIRKTDPRAKILSGGFAAAIPHASMSSPNYMSEALTAAKGNYDVISIHCHGPFDAYQKEIQYFLALKKQLGLESTPWIAGETGIPSVNITEFEQGVTLFQKLIYSWAHGAVGYLWYDFKNDGRLAWEPEHNFGLFSYDLEPKAGYVIYNALTRLLKKARFQQDLSSENYHCYEFSDEKNSFYPCWSTAAESDSGAPFWLLGQKNSTVKISDVFGNTQTVPMTHGGILAPVASVPKTYGLEKHRANAVKPFLTNHSCRIEGQQGTLRLQIANPLDLPISGSIALGKDTQEFSGGRLPFAVKANTTQELAISFRLAGHVFSGKIPLELTIDQWKETFRLRLFVRPQKEIPATANFRTTP
ncbi:MAG: cellulase family glycosylhydrolase, partial [Victivallaceae bacterium]|nr:cellulase family glycosylhydrolase [Victivallaceae bacterium]